jgi:hypothetical protein
MYTRFFLTRGLCSVGVSIRRYMRYYFVNAIYWHTGTLHTNKKTKEAQSLFSLIFLSFPVVVIQKVEKLKSSGLIEVNAYAIAQF